MRWRHTLPPGRVGGPGVRGGLVAVPVQSQYLVLLDAATGAELAQVLSTEEAASFVRALPEGLFYGSYGIFLCAPSTARGSRREPGYLRATLPPFVRPIYWYDLYRPEQSVYSAVDSQPGPVAGQRRRRPGAVPRRSGVRPSLPLLLRVRRRSGALRWAYSHPVSDAVASTDTGRALLFVTRDGEFGALDTRTGTRLFEARLGGDDIVRGATFDAEGFAPEAKADAAAPELLPSLATIVAYSDQPFWSSRPFAIGELGRLPGQQPSVQAARDFLE